jgi:hypothetical protein
LTSQADMSAIAGPVRNIRAFGALPDRATLASPAIQATIDAAHAAGGGVVYCPPGDYLIGSIELKSNVELHVAAGATLWGSTRKEDYDLAPKLPNPAGRHTHLNPAHLIFARGAENIAITGMGRIDGQGDEFFGPPKPPSLSFSLKGWRPDRLIALICCRNVLVEDITLSNSPGWMLWPLGCQQVRIHRARILTNPRGPNTDGIDPDCCRDVHISDCHIHTGDDCIAVKSSTNLLGEDRPCENITVTNCTLSSTCCAIRLGYEGDGPIRNCTFSNLVVFHSRSGVNMLVPRDAANQIEHGPPIENIGFSNLVMDTRIAFYLWIGDDAAAPGGIRNVSICNVRATTERACYFGGSRSIPVEAVRLGDIDLTVRGEMDDEFGRGVPYPYPVFDWWTKRGIPHGIYCRHVRGMDLSRVRVRWERATGPWRSALRCEQVEDLVIDGLIARQGPASDAPAVDLTDVRRAFVRGCRAEPGTGRFLRVGGPASSNIVAAGNDLTAAAAPFELAPDAPPGALVRRDGRE